mmetsp:Transcript_13953/g.34472  ORF Transcript_13953/g.34472 Transcript_13953/m.34472 type:complete len:761 (-) Transcript_13953:481-2763(-)
MRPRSQSMVQLQAILADIEADEPQAPKPGEDLSPHQLGEFVTRPGTTPIPVKKHYVHQPPPGASSSGGQRNGSHATRAQTSQQKFRARAGEKHKAQAGVDNKQHDVYLFHALDYPAGEQIAPTKKRKPLFHLENPRKHIQRDSEDEELGPALPPAPSAAFRSSTRQGPRVPGQRPNNLPSRARSRTAPAGDLLRGIIHSEDASPGEILDAYHQRGLTFLLNYRQGADVCAPGTGSTSGEGGPSSGGAKNRFSAAEHGERALVQELRRPGTTAAGAPSTTYAAASSASMQQALLRPATTAGGGNGNARSTGRPQHLHDNRSMHDFGGVIQIHAPETRPTTSAASASPLLGAGRGLAGGSSSSALAASVVEKRASTSSGAAESSLHREGRIRGEMMSKMLLGVVEPSRRALLPTPAAADVVPLPGAPEDAASGTRTSGSGSSSSNERPGQETTGTQHQVARSSSSGGGPSSRAGSSSMAALFYSERIGLPPESTVNFATTTTTLGKFAAPRVPPEKNLVRKRAIRDLDGLESLEEGGGAGAAEGGEGGPRPRDRGTPAGGPSTAERNNQIHTTYTTRPAQRGTSTSSSTTTRNKSNSPQKKTKPHHRGRGSGLSVNTAALDGAGHGGGGGRADLPGVHEDPSSAASPLGLSEEQLAALQLAGVDAGASAQKQDLLKKKKDNAFREFKTGSYYQDWTSLSKLTLNSTGGGKTVSHGVGHHGAGMLWHKEARSSAREKLVKDGLDRLRKQKQAEATYQNLKAGI